MIARLQRSFTFAPINLDRQRWAFWFGLSLIFAAVYGLLGLKQGFSGEWIVQDDARQHVFWMLRFVDPELFPNDLIANYFQSVAPVGYTKLYRLAAVIGINPPIFNKLLPPVIGLVATCYCFLLSRQIFPIPIAGFIASLLFNQNLWLKDDVISATPRAFCYPLLLAFLYYLTKDSLLPCLGTIALLGIFYPQYVFICAGMLLLQIFKWQGRRFRFSRNLDDYFFCAMGLGVSVAIMLPYALHVSEYGPVINLEQARQLPDFYPQGRSAFFRDSNWEYWFEGGRSGMFPKSLFTPVTMIFGLFLPVLRLFPRQFPLQKQIMPKITILLQLLAPSITMFFLAHAVLFKLHLPSRYTAYSFRIIFSIASAIVLTLILDRLLRIVSSNLSSLNFKKLGQTVLALFSIGAIATAVIFYPSFVDTFPMTKYKTGEAPTLYQFFQQQPKDITIASLTADTDNIPTFAQRSILVGYEYAIPYHLGYYLPFRQRVIDLIQAQYSTDLAEITKFIRKYGIDFWIVEESSFVPEYIDGNRWLSQHQPVAQQAVESLRQKKVPLLTSFKESCSVWQDNSFTVISTSCILSSSF
ncbi:hypothetical protein IQ238_29345 [Pleurocapsales cyanobacterium LEGE 06147]|nr:hypothetical protein [Pleurocapsales cyanobacterium LEGE 06147]